MSGPVRRVALHGEQWLSWRVVIDRPAVDALVGLEDCAPSRHGAVLAVAGTGHG